MGDVGHPSDQPVSGRPTSPLLRAKLRAPVVPDHYVRRPRLLRLLDEAVDHPLTLVVAPAGVGKTVLLAGWAAETGTATGWLSLDDSDRDPSQLWTGVATALDRLAPGCADAALARLRRPGGPAGVVEDLLDGLDTRTGPEGVLIVDDVHFAGGHATALSLATFLLHLPPWLHVVVLSRRQPGLPLDRMRARGQLREVHLAELQFSRPEAHEMLARMAPSRPEEWIETAAAQADGWAAGLQLAALAARAEQARGDAGVPGVGDEVLVDDYVWGEVLASEDRDLVDVLLDVAVVERVSASLARALTGRQDAGALLLRAEAQGLFVSRLGQVGWFELHTLVRRALLAELERAAPQRLAERHARAARWFQDEGETPKALDHWLAAGRTGDALRLLAATHAELYDSGREATVARIIAAIPAEDATADLGAMIEYAWCHLLVSRSRFAELVDDLTWWEDRSAPGEVTRARLAMLQSMAATIGGDWDEGGRLARRGMAELGQSWWQDPLGRFGWNMAAREVALSERWDEGDEVREAEHALGRLPQRRLALEGTRALGLALAGRPADALRAAAGVRRAAEVASMTILRAELAVAEAIAHRELGDHGRAVPELEVLASTPAETMLFCRVLACVELVQAHLDQGDVATARRVLAEGEALVEAESFGRGGRTWLARAGTLVALAAGDLDAAGRWAGRVDDPFWGGVCAARVHLAGGRRAEASTRLLESAPRCPRHEVVLGLLQARTVLDADVSARCVEAAVGLATTHGMLQTVASEGREVVERVEHAAWRAAPDWLDRLRRRVTDAGTPAPVVRTDQVEPLTERERDILRFLPSRLTIREIADERYVSVNTLKFHLKAIYRKLGVSSRAEAADLARRMTEVDRHA